MAPLQKKNCEVCFIFALVDEHFNGKQQVSLLILRSKLYCINANCGIDRQKISWISWRALFFHISISQKMALRKIIKSVPATKSGPIIRLIGSVDFKGQGINHPLESVDPVILLDYTGKFSGKGKIRNWGKNWVLFT